MSPDAVPAKEAIVMVDEHGVIEAFNQAARALLALTGSPLSGLRIVDLLRPAPGQEADMWVRLRDGLPDPGAPAGERRELRLWRANGTSFPARLAIVPVSVAGRSSYTCFIQDLAQARPQEARSFLSQGQLRELAGHIEAAREGERTHIARELHDELGQQLAAIGMDVAWLTRRVQRQEGNAPEVLLRLVAMAQLVDETSAAVRRLATELRPAILDNLGLVEAIRWQIAEFTRRSGVRVKLSAPAEVERVAGVQATALFRILQELLTNVGRHAAATRATVHLRETRSQIVLTVRDNGRGIRDQEAAGLDSFGLVGITERVALLGGRFEISGRPGHGTKATASLPLHRGLP
ncbi:hypothetical protein LBMAG42_33920 [Deltaproteobacteria bacterium]|nr:hypothetical protein LBMAG42_33920 [Deltaproteobacteria bacterium]